MKLKIKRLHPDAIIPKRVNSTDSGLDIYSIENTTIPVGGMIPIHTGIAIQLPKPVEITIFPTEIGVDFKQTLIWECQVRPRSGLAFKHGITVLNSPGTGDNSYRGEIIVMLQNHGKESFQVEKGMRVAQLVITSIITPKIIEVDELDDTERGVAGFGSSGLK